MGIESNSDKPVLVTFNGVEMLGDSLMLYDAENRLLTPLHSGCVTRMPGRTQNRFFIVSGGSDGGQVPSPASLLISARGATVRVLSTTGDVITSVQVCDTGGRLVCTASPCTASYSFQLPAAGIYVVKAGTERVQQVKKITY